MIELIDNEGYFTCNEYNYKWYILCMCLKTEFLFLGVREIGLEWKVWVWVWNRKDGN